MSAESLSNDMSAVYSARLFSRCDLPNGLPVDLSHLVISSALMLSLLSTFVRYLLNETLAHMCRPPAPLMLKDVFEMYAV